MGRETIVDFIERNLRTYPKMKKIDIYKEIYQSMYLTGHLLNDNSYKYLINEWDDVKSLSINKPLYEFIDSDVIRVNLESFNLDIDELYDLFKKSSEVKLDKDYYKYIEEYNLTEFYGSGIPSHSDLYRETYQPHYRVIYYEYIPLSYKVYKLARFIEEKRIEKNDNNKINFIAMEGLPYLGKAKIASFLEDVTVINMDEIDIYYLDKVLSSFEVGKRIILDCDNGISTFKKIVDIKDTVLLVGTYSYINFLRKYINYLVYCVGSSDAIEKKTNKKIDYDLKRYYQEYDFLKNADILI